MFVVLAGIYLLLQLPTYNSVFGLSDQPGLKWLEFLAYGKLLYGVSFYVLYFVPGTGVYSPIRFPALSIPSRVERAGAGFAASVVAGVVVHFLEKLLSALAHIIAK